MHTIRLRAVGGVIGPISFMGTSWLAGLATRRYSVIENAISDLAATRASTHLAMTSAFVIYGVGLLCFASALRVALDGPAWFTAAGAGVATLGLAAAPLGSPTIDAVHSWFALALGAAAALTPLLASRSFTSCGRDRWARASLVAGMVCFTCLMATIPGPARGLLQRTGLGAVHIWIVATAVEMIRNGRLGALSPAPSYSTPANRSSSIGAAA